MLQEPALLTAPSNHATFTACLGTATAATARAAEHYYKCITQGAENLAWQAAHVPNAAHIFVDANRLATAKLSVPGVLGIAPTAVTGTSRTYI